MINFLRSFFFPLFFTKGVPAAAGVRRGELRNSVQALRPRGRPLQGAVSFTYVPVHVVSVLAECVRKLVVWIMMMLRRRLP